MTIAVQQKNSSAVLVNSLVFFLLSYFFVIYLNNLFSIFLALIMGFDATLYYYGFDVSGDWTTRSIFTVYLIGPFITLLSGIVFEIFYRKSKEDQSRVKLFYLWVYIISYTWFFGNMIIGAFFYFGPGVAFETVQLSMAYRILIALVALLILFFLGYRSTKNIYYTANLYYQELENAARKSFLLNQVLWPVILGYIFIILYKAPNIAIFQYFDMYIMAFLFLFVIAMFINVKSITQISFRGDNFKAFINYNYLVLLVIIILVLRIGLASGLSFNI
ncbi:MAG: hypothetical protein U5Q03_17195 [Bacteroidota bacterium]|nr:hypothetical protein [Bacteroidota bacterium]